jgi:SAM-dependent methyltransferase
MAAWSHGYLTDVQYTGNYYPEMAPGFLAFACLRQLIRPPALEPGATYLELGCGQGYGLNLMAAANPGMTFWGTDFHPGQIANAQQLARTAGLGNVTFDDLSFEAMAELPDGRAPKFDVVALHGIYSWVGAESRAAIVRILDRFVKPGGLVYVSYNCLPGWGPLAPLQRFVREYADRHPGEPGAQAVAGLEAALKLCEDGARYFRSARTIEAHIREALKRRPAYLAHEYLHTHAEPFFHADVARDLEAARLAFAASASLADDVIKLAAPGPVQETIGAARDPVWRETLLDFASAKVFRRDVFVRGRNAVSRAERSALLEATPLALLGRPQDIETTFAVPVGNLEGDPKVYRPIIAALADGPMTWAELRGRPELAGVQEDVVFQAVGLLVGARRIHTLAPEGSAEPAAPRFNRAVLERLAFGELPFHLAAGRAGTGVQFELEEMLAIQGVLLDETEAETVRRGAQLMADVGRRLVKDGEVIKDKAANAAELELRIRRFTAEKLPVMRGLGVV